MAPIQPMHVDRFGAARFRANRIVSALLDSSPLDLNAIAAMDFSVEDREQFAMLLGYSLAGFSDLHFVTDATYERAEREAAARGLIRPVDSGPAPAR